MKNSYQVGILSLSMPASEYESFLKQKVGEGSFMGVKHPKTSEEMVEWLRHLYAYKFASGFAERKSVLDVGCGTGYGICEVSDKASTVIGVDIWKERVRYAHGEYGNRSSFLVASALNLPFRDSCFDLITSFQVIEHVEDVVQYLHEIKRVLKDEGMFIVSTPNRKLRLLPFQKPWNPEHKKEYDAKELNRVLRSVFKNSKVLGLSATREVYLIEYRRVHQNPLFVYVLNPLLYIVEDIVPKLFLSTMKRIIISKTVKAKTPIKSQNVSIGDFKLSQNLDSCLDIYGICRKSSL